MSQCYKFVRHGRGGSAMAKIEHGIFADDEAACRYSRQFGFDGWAPDPETETEFASLFDGVDGMTDLSGKLEAIVSNPATPGEAFSDAFDPIIAAEGYTSDVSDAYVAPNVVLYSVTRTVEVTVPVYAADKAGAIAAIKDVALDNLVNNTGAVIKTFATTARARSNERA